MTQPRIESTLHELDNGLRIVLHRDARLPLVSVNLWYHVGSKHERPGRTGLAHLFEHMLFQGSEHVPENGHFQYVQQVGGVANGSTWYDRTNYYETLPSHQLDLGLWLESDRMGFLLPAMTSEKVENQRSVVMNERRQRVDNQPYGRAGERVHELLYPSDHPYHWPVIGYMEDIEAASLDDIRDFFREHYSPNNAVLTLAGDFVEEAALESVERYFGALERGPVTTSPAPRPLPVGAPLQRERLEDEIRLPRLYRSFGAAAYGTSEWYAAVLLAEILAGSKASRLSEELVYQRQTAQWVTAWILPTEECATFTLIVSGKPDSNPGELEEIVHDHLRKAGAGDLRPEEIDEARTRILAGHLHRLQSLDQRADMLSQATTFFDDPERIHDGPTLLAQQNVDSVTAAARHLAPDTGISITVVPRDRQPTITTPTEAAS